MEELFCAIAICKYGTLHIEELEIWYLGDHHFVYSNPPLPDGLRKLTFGPEFNFRIDHIRLPDSVEIIQMGKWLTSLWTL